MDLSEEYRVLRTSSGILIFHRKYGKGGRYSGIFCKDRKNVGTILMPTI